LKVIQYNLILFSTLSILACTPKPRSFNTIPEYEEHIEARLKDPDRPSWENPHFYQLLIGDLYLKDNKPKEALKSYLKARKHGVEDSLISDRIRGLAKWYIDKAKKEDAFQLLKTWGALDPLLFDGLLDELARKMTAEEDNSAQSP
jgi:predicted Zn-dependent protease